MNATVEDARSKAEAKRTLMQQAKELGMEVDKRWSVETLAEKVVEAQAEHEEKQAKAIDDASDTWVMLLRGAWPTSMQKYPAGSVIKIPEDMAERWIEAGACRPASKNEIARAENA